MQHLLGNAAKLASAAPVAAGAGAVPAYGAVSAWRCGGGIALRRGRSSANVRPLSRRSLGTTTARADRLTPCSASSPAPSSLTTGMSTAATKLPNYRRASTMSGPYGTYEAVVVGAGPAGVTCVGNLLERKIEPILWVDNAFDGGRINKAYREVPSNTKAALFIDFATAVAPFRKIVSGTPSRSRWEEPSESDAVRIEGKPDKLQALRELDQTKGCELSYAADMILMLTEGLRRTPGVITQKGKVIEAVLDEGSTQWRAKLENPNQGPTDISSVQTKRLILCTGSSPTEVPLPGNVSGLPHLDLDTALSPSLLAEKLMPLGETTVSVIGASHSAILVLRNLYHLAKSRKPDLKIRWLTRHALRYAEYMEGWILRDNTGLKGEVAIWAKAHLEPEVFPQSDVCKYVEAISYEKGEEEKAFEQHLPGTDLVVQAVGYTRDPIPALRTIAGKGIAPYYDHEKGSFNYVKESDCGSIGDLAKLPGVYGAGIAWPERVKDPHGNVEYAVGFFKFMKYIKRVSPDWN